MGEQCYLFQVLGLFYKYYELRPAKPKLIKLQQLLQEFPYKGPEFENVKSDQLHTFHGLLDLVQASENELKYALIERQAVCIKGIILTRINYQDVYLFK